MSVAHASYLNEYYAKIKTAVSVRMRVLARKTTPSPAIASVLGPRGVNPMAFIQQINAYNFPLDVVDGEMVRVLLYILKDRTFLIECRGLPLTHILKKLANITKGSITPGKEIVASLHLSDLQKLAEKRMLEMGVKTCEAATRCLIGTAKSMGIKVII